MHRRGRPASSARSSTEECSVSSVSDRISPSTVKPQNGAKRGKSGRTVSSLTKDQLERKRSNDRHAQKKIRDKTKERMDNYEAAEMEYKQNIVALRHEVASLSWLRQENRALHDEVEWCREHHKPDYPQIHESRSMSINPRRESIATDASISWSHQQSRRHSQAEIAVRHASSMTPSPQTMTSGGNPCANRPSAFPDPPDQYRCVHPTQREPPLPPSSLHPPPSSSAYLHGHHSPLSSDTAHFHAQASLQPGTMVYTSSRPLQAPAMHHHSPLPKLEPQSPQEGSGQFGGWVTDRSILKEHEGSNTQSEHQYAYAPISHQSPETARYHEEVHDLAQLPQYQHQNGYAHVAVPGGHTYSVATATTYTPPVPHYGPVGHYPQQLHTSATHHVTYPPAGRGNETSDRQQFGYHTAYSHQPSQLP